jgi:methylmalonyl-CoA/ethylmalonyl-CoA epimerase
MARIFDKLHHICLVVADIDAAQKHYESLGFAPWIDYPPLVEYVELDVPDPVAFKTMRYRVCNLGNAQLQLCQPGEGPSPQRAFLDRHGPGVFHLGFEVPDADAAEDAAKERGIKVKMRGRRKDRTGFTYYDTAEHAGVTLLTRATPQGSKT